MNKDLMWAGLFVLSGVWLALDTLWHWDRKDLDKMLPGRRYLSLSGAVILITVGILYMLDTLRVLH